MERCAQCAGNNREIKQKLKINKMRYIYLCCQDVGADKTNRSGATSCRKPVDYGIPR